MHGRLQILIATPDGSAVDALGHGLRDHGHVVAVCGDGREALAAIESHDYDLAVLDVELPSLGGFEILRRARAAGCATEVVLTSCAGSIADAVAAIKADAYDYLGKPIELARLIELIGEIAQRRVILGAQAGPSAADGGLLGRSRAMIQARDRLNAFAETDAPVMVLGASGTGKELAARLVHDRSARRNAPFVAINCAAFPDGLIEAEMFGHVRGAFTGATRDRKGRIATAEGGTLFLDEVAELTPSAQAKLLRVLEEKRYCAVGSSTPVAADIRLVSATNQDIKRAITDGRFREDLYFRLRVLDVRMPSLVERHGDLPLLVDYFLHKYVGASEVPKLSAPTWAALQLHPFPGNVRELDHVICRAVTLARADSRGHDIRLDHLPDDMSGDQREEADPAGALPLAIERFEREVIRRVLGESQGNRSAAARALGISRKQLWQKIRAYHLSDDLVPS